MTGLGVQGDAPAVSIQPKLKDGIHLRWATTPDLAFPWFGFFLFRRQLGNEAPKTCIFPLSQHLPPGLQSTASIVLARNEVVESDLPINLTEDFPPANSSEVDFGPVNKQPRAFVRLRMPLSRFATEAQISIGFRKSSEKSVVRITAFNGETAVASEIVSGTPGAIVNATIAADSFDSVLFEAMPSKTLPDAALVQFCYFDLEQGARQGWRPVPNCPQPITLPLTHPDYPATGNQPENENAARGAAIGRVSYGNPAPFAAAFSDLHTELVRLVKGGPASVPMNDPSRATAEAGQYDPPDPTLQPPNASHLNPLDLVNLASLHPAIAQMLGLYWVDLTAVSGQIYDYLILADASGVAGGKAQGALAAWKSGSLMIEGYICSNLHAAQAPPLPPPPDVRSYALSGATIANQGGAGVTDATLVAGLLWDRQATITGDLLPSSPVLYHAWREARGQSALPTPSTESGVHITSNGPILIGLRIGSPFVTPQMPADWPPFSLYRLDRPGHEGWYSYRVSGMDIFGRISAMSPPAPWFQWAPVPDPRPYYYKDPPGNSIVYQDAIQLLDRTPPPMPAGVEAWALDPADPFLVQDNAYNAWRLSLPAAVRNTLVGLRVRWRWTEAQMRQAPDTVEFRVYYNGIAFPPGSPPAPPIPTEADLVATAGWAERAHVTLYAADFAPEADGSRTYQVFLPRPGGPPAVFPNGLPLNPSLAEPVAYAYVGVSAADGTLAADDDPKWNAGGWGHRAGNESRASSPAKIYRVWRQTPLAPAIPPNSERVFATPADYHDRSYYTYRWRPQPFLHAHICRAVDESIFTLDWNTRVPNNISVNDNTIFPDAATEPRWSATKRHEVAAEINQFSALPRTPEGKQQALVKYRALSNDALRVLASLPAAAPAFVQLTTVPLDPNEAANANRRGPDNPENYTVDPKLRIYIDTLDGRANNRYFYRALYVDQANNRGQLSLSGPPVWLPNVVAPRAPALQAVQGGDRQIAIAWASNRERDLVAYRVYRADSTAAARDIRSMTLVHTRLVAAGEPSARPASVMWTDTPLPGLTPFYYRVTAVDDADNESPPTPMVTGRAVDASPPDPAAVDGAIWLRINAGGVELPFAGASASLPAAVRVDWSGPAPEFEYLVQRRSGPTNLWQSRAPWLQQCTYLDLGVDETLDYEFRVLTRKPSNKMTSASSALAAKGK